MNLFCSFCGNNLEQWNKTNRIGCKNCPKNLDLDPRQIYQKYYPLPQSKNDVTPLIPWQRILEDFQKRGMNPSLRYRISRNQDRFPFLGESGEEDRFRKEWFWRNGTWEGDFALKFKKNHEKTYSFKKGVGFLNQCPSNWGRGDRISLYFDPGPIPMEVIKSWIQDAPLGVEWGEGGNVGVWEPKNPRIQLSMKNLTPPRKIKFLKYIQALFRKLKVCDTDFKSKE